MSAADQGAGAALWAMAGLATPMAVRVAATLRVADHLAAGRRTAAELARAVQADPDALARLLRFLAARGVLSRDGTGRYGLTPTGEALRDDHPAGVRGWLDMEGAGRAELAFVQLLHSVRTGEAGFPVQFHRAFYDDLNDDPARAGSFYALISARVPAWSRDILSCGLDWGALGHVVDVGGGNGVVLIDLLTAYPSLRGTLVDRPETVDVARKALATAGVADRGDVVAASFFDPLPPGAGGYLLSLVIHNWPDDAAREILRRCAEAAGAHGSVFIVENVGADGASPPHGADLRMLVYSAGKERTVAQVGELGGQVGLGVAAVHPAGALSIIELTAR